MSKCIKCGSYAFNLYKEDIDQGGLCDVHYWQVRAHRAEALAEQPAPVQQGWETVPVEPTVAMIDATGAVEADMREMVVANWKEMLAAAPQPAQRTWVGLMDEDKQRIHNETGAGHSLICIVESAIETKLKENNR